MLKSGLADGGARAWRSKYHYSSFVHVDAIFPFLYIFVIEEVHILVYSGVYYKLYRVL